jgi:hypothetical protein
MASIDLAVILSGNSFLESHASEAFSILFSGNSSLALGAGVKLSGRVNLHGDSGLTSHAGVKYFAHATFGGSSGFVATSTVSLGIQSPIRYQPASRTVNVSKLVFDQVDLFLVDGKTCAQSVTIADLNLKIFFKGSRIEWPLVSGTNVQDLQVTAGQVYWTEVEAGFYTLRFFPNVIGAWRILLTYPAYDQAVSLSYDVAQPTFVSVSSGIHASFVKR